MFDINLVLFAICFFLATGMVVHFLAKYRAERWIADFLDSSDGNLIVDEHDPTDVKVRLEFSKDLDDLIQEDNLVLNVVHRS